MPDFIRTILSGLIIAFQVLQGIFGMPLDTLVFNFETQPIVFETGDDMYTVMWTTTKCGTGKVTYTYNGTEYTATDHVGGNIRFNDKIHSVRVPKKHLDNNTYTVSSQLIPFKGAYSAVKGKTITSEPINFKGYNNQEAVNALILSDIHGITEAMFKAVASFEEKPDIIILNGDIADHMMTKEQFLQILDISRELSKGETPVVYARGNHEPRGAYASEFVAYFKTSTGNLYYTFNYGPVWAVVLDCGEDKPDDHAEYSGLADFSTYINTETQWLKNLSPDTTEITKYRLCITHNTAIRDEYGNDWTPELERLEIDDAIFGHLHRLDLRFSEGKTSFSQHVTGGKNGDGFIATMMTFSDDRITFVSKDETGAICGEYSRTI